MLYRSYVFIFASILVAVVVVHESQRYASDEAAGYGVTPTLHTSLALASFLKHNLSYAETRSEG